jgi:Zn ribbon nucleic-acid-binding protein
MNQNVKSILLAIVLIGGVAWAGTRFFKVAKTSENNVDFPDGAVWYCPQEEKEFSVTLDDLAKWYEENGDVPYPCPSCGYKETYRPDKTIH